MLKKNNIKGDNYYENIFIKKRFDIWNYKAEKPLPIDKSKKIVGIMKEELSEEIVKEFVEMSKNIFLQKTSQWRRELAKRTKKKCN